MDVSDEEWLRLTSLASFSAKEINSMTGFIHLFVGGMTGKWRVESASALTGPPLTPVPRLAILEGSQITTPPGGVWFLRGVTSYERYVQRAERSELVARQPVLGRPSATRAALIPIKKSVAWWELTQDERRVIFEERSHHITIGLRYLPAIARRLYHSHDLGEPFDFLTWFEYAPADAEAFEELVGTLRETEEWTYVEREIDIRLVYEDSLYSR
jgi:chlorite dismutase